MTDHADDVRVRCAGVLHAANLQAALPARHAADAAAAAADAAAAAAAAATAAAAAAAFTCSPRAISVDMSASFFCISWFAARGDPNCLRSSTYLRRSNLIQKSVIMLRVRHVLPSGMHAELSGAERAPADAVARVVEAGEGAGEARDIEAGGGVRGGVEGGG